MRLNDASAACGHELLQQRRGPTAASVATKPSIVAMLGWIMPAPLVMPVTVTVRPSIVDLARRGLGHRVGGHDRLGRRGPVRPATGRPARRQAGLDAIDGQRLHDHAGGKRQHLRVLEVEQRRRGGARAPRAPDAVGRRCRRSRCRCSRRCARIGSLSAEVLAADLHRRGAEAVAREHAGHTAALVQRHEQQVLAIGLADAGARCRGGPRERRAGLAGAVARD